MSNSNYPLFTIDCIATEATACGHCKYGIPLGTIYPVQNTNHQSVAPPMVKMCLLCALYYWHKAISNGLQGVIIMNFYPTLLISAHRVNQKI